MEVCVDCVSSAKEAAVGGAVRVELCSNLMEGGTTPSVGMLRVIKQRVPDLPVFVMIRPRGGDFCYTEEETAVMIEDINALAVAGADGFVFGVLKHDGTVDTDKCRQLLEQMRPLPATFHRAIDMSSDITRAMEDIISLGFERILTSGGEATALEGLPVLKQMVGQAAGRIVIMPGGGINDRNLERILEGCGAEEFHGSARRTLDSKMEFRKTSVAMGASLSPPEFSVKITNSQTVQKMVKMFGLVKGTK